MARLDDQAGDTAARAGAEDSLLDLSRVLPHVALTAAEEAAQEESWAADRAYFSKNPGALSYARRYYPQEVSSLLLRAMGKAGQPVGVAVALVTPDERCRVMIWPGTTKTEARNWAEQRATAERLRLGLRPMGGQ